MKHRFSKYCILASFLLLIIQLKAQSPIVGYSSLINLNTQQLNRSPLTGTSGSFSLNTQQVNASPITGTSSLFNYNVQSVLMSPLAGLSQLFFLATNFFDSISGYSNLYHLNTKGDFYAEPTELNPFQPVQFTAITTAIESPVSFQWNFGDLSLGSNRFNQNPIHFYSRTGIHTVQLTITDNLGIEYKRKKEAYVIVTGPGIHLQLVKTAPDSGPEISKVGYYYTTKANNQTINHLATFYVVNDLAFIDNFPALHLPSDTTLVSSFNNEIILFDQNMSQIGHIHYDYEPETERAHKRDAILILHNDSDICADGAYPYSTASPEYDPMWKYYKIGEYPVSMLMPPNNTFQANYSKTPLLMIHGWEGAFSLNSNPNAVASANETSYWFTTVYELNEPDYPFDAWQYYYPYNDAHEYLAICLKYASEKLKTYYPNQKLKLITHSMGGLVTLRYLAEYNNHAKQMVEKVLFSAPPVHGSLGANLYYKTEGSELLESAIEMDANAPSVRDMKLGSDATWFIYDNPLPDLNNSGGIEDDYFVLSGTTYKWYLTDKKFIAFNKVGQGLGINTSHSSVHPEAANHHDGIVAISSASLLDKGIGFATFHGNHNDAKNMQSFQRGNKRRQNIGDPTLLPEIIKQYFTQNQTNFFNYLQGESNITAVVKPDRSVLKPAGQNSISNMNTGNGVDYQKGILTIELSETTDVIEYRAYYHAGHNTLALSIDKIRANGYSSIGVFKRVINNLEPTNRYYYNDKVLMAKGTPKDDRAITYNGCAISLNEGINSVFIKDEYNQIVTSDFVQFRFCETKHKVFNITNNLLRTAENNYTDSKHGDVLQEGAIVPDSLLMPFYIDDQAVSVRYSLSSFEAVVGNVPVWIKLKLPDGTIADSTFSGSVYHHNKTLGLINMEISNPMPGLWHVWLETDEPAKDDVSYTGVAHIQSDVYAFMADTTDLVAANSPHTLKAGLQADDLNLASGWNVTVAITNPDWEEEVFDITASIVMQDTCYIFSLDYEFDIPGSYRIKYNIDGIYNNFNFERCLHHYIEVVDTIPALTLPDITLRQNENFRQLNLLSYTRNISGYDTIYFTSEILESNVDTIAFSALMDTTATIAYIFSNLADTGMVKMRFICHYDELSIVDTMFVNIMVPDLVITEAVVSDTIISNNGEIIIDFAISNTGNFHTGSYEVRYYIMQDSTLQVSDFALGSHQIIYHEPDSVLIVSDTIMLPHMSLAGNYFLMIYADATGIVSEIDETNNQALIPVTVNPPPDVPIIIAAVADNEEVQLSYTAGGQDGITGYVIYYGQDTTEVLQTIFPYSTNTTYTITGLMNDSTYYFAVSCYRTVNNESQMSGLVSAIPRDISATLQLTDVLLGTDVDTCFAATETIIISDFVVQSNASVILVAGENILLQPSIQIESGAYLHAYIDTTGNYCWLPESILTIPEQDLLLESHTKEDLPQGSIFNIYPNPTAGRFTLELIDAEESSIISMSIYGMLGELILQSELHGSKSYEFDLSGKPRGIYLVRVMKGSEAGVMKLIKQ